MGSKNRILLGILINQILHVLRNTFTSKELYITKAKLKKIQIKHNEIYHYLENNNFQKIIDNTIGICSYKANNEIINFISIVDNNIFLYSISTKNFYIYIGTFFKSDKRKVLKQCSNKIKFLDSKKEEIFNNFM